MKITVNRSKDGTCTIGGASVFGQLSQAAKNAGGTVKVRLLGGTPDRLGNVREVLKAEDVQTKRKQRLRERS